MSQQAVKRLYLMQVGSMPQYQMPIVCHLVQTGDGKQILIDSGLPETMPAGYANVANGQDVIAPLARSGLKPDDGSDPDAAAIRASTNKLLDLVERERIGLVIFGHEHEQWEGLKKLPEYYE